MVNVGPVLIGFGVLVAMVSTVYSLIDTGLTRITYFGFITTAVLAIVFIGLVFLR